VARVVQAGGTDKTYTRASARRAAALMPRHAGRESTNPAAAQVIDMSLFNQHESFMQPPPTHTGRGERHHGGDAHFVEPEEDPCIDQVLVDPLDDRDRRCARRIRAH